MTLNDLIGTIGVGLILLAYFLNMFSLIKKDGNAYFIINILGAGIAWLAAVLIHFMPFIILEAAWVIVSVVGLVKNIKKSQA
jgi:O-antigen ligase